MNRKQRAARADQLLRDELFMETWEGLRKEALFLWENTIAEDHAAREDAWRTIKVLTALKEKFENYVRQGKADQKIRESQPIDVHPTEKQN